VPLLASSAVKLRPGAPTRTLLASKQWHTTPLTDKVEKLL
jgi:hypothetical protein